MRLTQAAALFLGESHQVAAFNIIEASLTPEQMEEFTETFNAGPPRSPCPSMEALLQRHHRALGDPPCPKA